MTTNVSDRRLAHRVLAVVTAIAVLFVWSASSAQARALAPGEESSPVSSGFISDGDGVQYLDTADGRWVVETDKTAREMTVTSPGGEVEHFGPDSPIWTETLPVEATPDVNGSSGQVMAANSTACTWAVWFIGAIHTGGWGYAVGLLALNPPAALALTAVVTLGYGAFWNWVSTQC